MTRPRGWTFMVYMAANNNLSPSATRDLDELRQVGASEDVNVLAFAKDEYRVMIHSVVLGKGKRLFADPGPRINLKLKDQKVAITGTLILHYEVEK